MHTSTRGRRFGGALLAATAVAGLLTLVTSASPASAAPVAAPVRIVRLANADAGRTVTVGRGGVIVVSLAATGPRFAWTAPASDNNRVVATIASATRSDGGALALFQARTRGTTTISAVSACKPIPGEVCPFAAILWRVTIDVT